MDHAAPVADVAYNGGNEGVGPKGQADDRGN
jgi:hypothetical protein